VDATAEGAADISLAVYGKGAWGPTSHGTLRRALRRLVHLFEVDFSAHSKCFEQSIIYHVCLNLYPNKPFQCFGNISSMLLQELFSLSGRDVELGNLSMMRWSVKC
jgi:hypothetical protein